MNICQHCQKEFEPRWDRRRYCSVLCRQSARKAYQRAYRALWLTMQSSTYQRDAKRHSRAKNRKPQGGFGL